MNRFSVAGSTGMPLLEIKDQLASLNGSKSRVAPSQLKWIIMLVRVKVFAESLARTDLRCVNMAMSGIVAA